MKPYRPYVPPKLNPGTQRAPKPPKTKPAPVASGLTADGLYRSRSGKVTHPTEMHDAHLANAAAKATGATAVVLKAEMERRNGG